MSNQSTQPLRIGIVLYPDVLLSSVYGLQELFFIANQKAAEQEGLSHALFDVVCWADEDFDAVMPNTRCFGIDEALPDLIILPPAMGEQPPSAISVAMKQWLLALSARGSIFASACVGAFVLAAAGMLHDRTCTTHWGLATKLSQQDSSISVNTDKILIDDGDIITAGGVMAWMDLGLHIVHRFAGPNLVMALSKFFIVDTGHREQRFYQNFTPHFNHGDGSVTRLQQHLQTHYSDSTDLEGMSQISHISQRTLQRRFTAATGFSPTVYLQRLRIQKAKEQLETTKQGIDQIAFQVGYEDLSALRKRFKQWLGLSPSEYRKRFKQSDL